MNAWWFCTLAFGIVFASIRLASIDFPLFWDEWISIFFTHLPTAKLWSNWMVNESNPPLYYSMLKAWTALFGSTPYSARVLSIVGGLLGMIVLAWCAYRISGIWGAVTAYAICTFSSQDVFYSLFIRSYIFVLLSFAVSLLGIIRAIDPACSAADRNRGLVLYALGAAAGIYFHTTMLLWPVAATLTVGGLMVADKNARKLFVPWIVANLAVALLSAWWIYITLRQVQTGANWVVWTAPMSGHEYASALRQSIMFLRSNTGIFKPASYLLIAVACIPLLRRDRTMTFLAGLLLVSIAVFFAAQLIKPIIYQKTVWWMTGLVVILVSSAIARLRQLPLRLAAIGLVSALLIADLIVARPGFPTHDWSGFVRFAARQPGSPVVMVDKEAAIIFNEACRAEYGQQCPVRSVLLLRRPAVRSWADEYSGPLLMWTPGQRAPIDGPVILLRDGLSPDQWIASSGGQYEFGTLRAMGPAPLQDLLRPR